jgi:radical SAM superfamily enzyme YgiQ (UPF0313 family)
MAQITVVYLDIQTGYYPGFHHGLASLAGAVKARGHKFRLIHLTQEVEPEALLKEILQFPVDILGFSLTTNQKIYLKKYIEAIGPKINVPIIAGGVHPTIEPEEVLNLQQINGVCIGEAEVTLPALLDFLDSGRPIEETSGFYFKGADGRIYKNSMPEIVPLESLPLPDYSIFDVEVIMKHSSRVAHMMVTRGCPYNCYYCGNHVLRIIYPNKKDFVRLPSVDYVIKMIKNNLSIMGQPRHINFDDDLITFNSKWLEEFCYRYKREIDIPFMCNGRVMTLKQETVRMLKDAGCDWMYVGVESGNEWVRRNLLNRRESNEQIIDAFRLIHEYRIKSCSYNIMGFPFETYEQMRDTVDINIKIKPNNGICYFFYPYPKTRLFEICRQFDLLKPEAEKLRGYKEGIAIRLTHIDKEDLYRQYYTLQGYFFSRAALTAAHIDYPGISPLISRLAMINGKFIVKYISQNQSLKRFTRKISYKYLFSKERLKEA